MSGSSNRVADALSRKHALVASMQIDVMRFDSIKELRPDDTFFPPILVVLRCRDESPYSLHDGSLFLGDCLCIIRLLLMNKAHNLGPFGHANCCFVKE